MDNNTFNNRRFVGRLIYAVLTEQKSVREAISLFPDTKDKDIECAYHALVHYAADEDIRYKDFEYREEQDDYLEFIAQTLVNGKNLPKNIVADYEEYYHGTSHKWQNGFKGFLKEFLRFINIWFKITVGLRRKNTQIENYSSVKFIVFLLFSKGKKLFIIL